MNKEKIRERAIDITNGLATSLNTFLLFAIFFHLDYQLEWAEIKSRSVKSRKGESQSKAIKSSLYNLTTRGLLKSVGPKGRKRYKITATGKKRLGSLVPFYDEERVWDGKIYLVTYDIAEKKKPDREVLREYLKKIGCGMLQKSVWLTVYDPAEVLREFIEGRGLVASVLVSCVGKDGHIGRESIKDVVEKVFDLEGLNRCYQEYFNEYASKKKINRSQATFDFLSILRDDPQLPFELLPPDWTGYRAYELFKKLKKPAV